MGAPHIFLGISIPVSYPILVHEEQFETFPGPVYAILNAGLLYCSEQLARRTDA
jgi:hypothetical protein